MRSPENLPLTVLSDQQMARRIMLISSATTSTYQLLLMGGVVLVLQSKVDEGRAAPETS